MSVEEMIARGQQNDRSKKRCWGQQGQLTSGQAGIIQMGCELERPGVVTVQLGAAPSRRRDRV
jgi:hypothetical protein